MSTKCTNLVKTISNNSMHVIIFDYRRIKTFSKLIVFKKINQREVINIKIWNGTFLTELNRLFSKILDFQNFKQAKIQGPTQVFGFKYQTKTSMVVVDYNKSHFDCTSVIENSIGRFRFDKRTLPTRKFQGFLAALGGYYEQNFDIRDNFKILGRTLM